MFYSILQISNVPHKLNSNIKVIHKFYIEVRIKVAVENIFLSNVRNGYFSTTFKDNAQFLKKMLEMTHYSVEYKSEIRRVLFFYITV